MSEITTSVGICNLALGHLGKPPISAIGEATRGGQLCGLHYEATRNALLRAHPWNFAIKRATLAEDSVASDALPFEYEHAFTLPSDCLKVVRTSQEADGLEHDYRIEKRYLLTDETDVSIEYVYKCTTVGDYDALFIQLLALDLAIRMCMVLANSNSLLQTLTEMRKDMSPGALTIDAQEGASRDGYDVNNWLNGRL